MGRELFCGEFARLASKRWIVQLSSANYFGLVTFLPWARIASWACLLANFGFNGQSKHVTRQVYTAALNEDLLISHGFLQMTFNRVIFLISTV